MANTFLSKFQGLTYEICVHLNKCENIRVKNYLSGSLFIVPSMSSNFTFPW
jgi:hypothetical protein